MKRFLVLTLIMIMSFTAFSVNAAVELQFDGMQPIRQMMYSDSFDAERTFSQGKINGHIMLLTGADYTNDGHITLDSDDDDSVANDTVRFYLNKDMKSVSGKIGIQWSMTRTTPVTSGGVTFFIDNRSFDMRWQGYNGTEGDGSIDVYDMNQNTVAKRFKSTAYNTAEKIDVTLQLDTITGEVSVWINGKNAVNGEKYLKPGAISRLAITNEGEFTSTVDDFCWYYIGDNGMPYETEVYCEQDFETASGNVSADTTTYANFMNGSNASASDGAMKIEQGGTIQMWANSDKKAVEGKVLVEALFSRTSSGTDNDLVQINVNNVLSMNWFGTDDSSSREITGPSKLSLADYQAYDVFKLTVLVDKDGGTYKAWINDKFAYEGTTTKDFARITINATNAPVSVENFKVSYVGSAFEVTGVELKKTDNNKAELISATNKSLAVVVAGYSAENLAEVKILPAATLQEGVKYIINSSKVKGDSVRVFLWDSMSSIVPITEDISIR